MFAAQTSRIDQKDNSKNNRNFDSKTLLESLRRNWASSFSPTLPYSASPIRFLRPPAIQPNLGSPPQLHRQAYASLSVGDSFVLGTLVLFHSLKAVEAEADFVAMIYNMSPHSVKLLHSYGIRTYTVAPLDVTPYRDVKGESMEYRDGILWSKLR